MRRANLDEEALTAFLMEFYAKVRRDDLIGPVFAAHVADDAWPRHMATIQDFWSSVLFRTGQYKGNPFGKHVAIEGIAIEHFQRWLGLFRQTAEGMFEPAIADALAGRADRIGDSLKAGLFFRPIVSPADRTSTDRRSQ